MSAAGKQYIADRRSARAQEGNDRLRFELKAAKDGLTRIAGSYRFQWEASAACVALSAIARLEALAMDALNELKEGESNDTSTNPPAAS